MMEDHNEKTDDLIPLRQVAKRFGVSVRTIWRMVARGELPKPVQVGKQAALFLSDVETFLARLKASRPTPQQQSNH